MGAYERFLSELELFYADFVRELARHEQVACVVPDAAHVEKMVRLSGLGPEFFPQASLPDVWIRDFAPLPTHGRFVKFRYQPPYVNQRLNRQVEEAVLALLAELGIPIRRVKIALDGGNLVHNGAGIGITTRSLVSRNRGSGSRAIVEQTRRALGLERLVVVPPEPGDRTGHVDGLVRWATPDLLLVNDYRRIPGGFEFQKRLGEVLDAELGEVERVALPYTWCSSKLGGWYDARGNYANFLRTANRVYVPLYGVADDREAERIFEQLFPGRVSTVRAEAIARYGGSLNCVAWNY